MVSARDFVGLQFCELNSDNATALFFSVVNTNYPENEGVTRAHQYVFIITYVFSILELIYIKLLKILHFVLFLIM